MTGHRTYRAAAVAAVAAWAVSLAGAAGVHADPTTDPTMSNDCVDVGARICAPYNGQGVAPGCYDDGGVLAFAWPCNAWTPADGWRHGDGTLTYPSHVDGQEYQCTQAPNRTVRCELASPAPAAPPAAKPPTEDHRPRVEVRIRPRVI